MTDAAGLSPRRARTATVLAALMLVLATLLASGAAHGLYDAAPVGADADAVDDSNDGALLGFEDFSLLAGDASADEAAFLELDAAADASAEAIGESDSAVFAAALAYAQQSAGAGAGAATGSWKKVPAPLPAPIAANVARAVANAAGPLLAAATTSAGAGAGSTACVGGAGDVSMRVGAASVEYRLTCRLSVPPRVLRLHLRDRYGLVDVVALRDLSETQQREDAAGESTGAGAGAGVGGSSEYAPAWYADKTQVDEERPAHGLFT